MKKYDIKYIAFTLIGLIISTNQFANNFKVPLDISLVPSHISENFYANHIDIENHSWYPYPYFNDRSEKENQRYFSKLTYVDQTAFYEVEFVENGSKYRKIFDQQGKVQIWSEIVKDYVLSEKIKHEMSSVGYSNWKVENYEKVILNNFDNEIKHKVILSKESKTRVIYLNENESIYKVLKWELQVYAFNKKKTVYLRSAFQGDRNEIAVKELPESINSILIEKDVLKKVQKIHAVDAVHIPEHRIILDYYDVPLHQKYEVIYSKGPHLLKAIFSAEGDLLEENKVIELQKAPKYVQEEIAKQKYTFWQFDHLVDIVYLEDGTICYRLHAQEFGIAQLLVLNSK